MRANTTQDVLNRFSVLQAWAIRLIHERRRTWSQYCHLLRALQLFKENKPLRTVQGPNPKSAWYDDDQLIRKLCDFGFWQAAGQSKSLSPEILAALSSVGICTLADLIELEASDLRQIRTLGANGVEELEEFLYFQLPGPALGGAFIGIRGWASERYAVRAQPIEVCFDALAAEKTKHRGFIRVQVMEGANLEALAARLGKRRRPHKGLIVFAVTEIIRSGHSWQVSGPLASIDGDAYFHVRAQLHYSRDSSIHLGLEGKLPV